MSQINGTCATNTAQALFEQHIEQLQWRRLEENQKTDTVEQFQAVELNPETGVKHVTEVSKEASIDF